MPLLSIARFFTTLLSLALLAAAGYLLWSWYDGDWVRRDGDVVERVREDWRLWTGLGLLAWSFLGRAVWLRLLAGRDRLPMKPERANGQTVAGYSGSKIYVEEHGRPDAPPIIFIHGWGMDSTFWAYAKRDLADRFRLVLWDLPGLGRSRAGPDGVKLSAFAADLRCVIEGCGRRRPVLVGHSIGGMTIQTLVMEQVDILDRVAGVVLLNTTYTNPIKTMVFSGPLRALQKPLIEPLMHVVRWLQPLVWASQWQSYLSGSAHLANRLGFGRFVTRSQLEHVTLLGVRNPPAVQARGNLAMLNWDATGALDAARLPVLVIGGDRDIVTKLEASRIIAEHSRRGRLHVVSGVNHMGPLERADLYNQLIGDFALSVQDAAWADAVSQSRTPSEASSWSRQAGAPLGDDPKTSLH